MTSSKGISMKGMILILASVLIPCALQGILIEPDRESGVYHKGETITWLARLEEGESADKLHYSIKRHGLTPVGEGAADLIDGSAIIAIEADEPGTFMLRVRIPEEEGSGEFVAGAAVDPECIESIVDIPGDFDTFWQQGIAELMSVPANPRLEWLPSGEEGILYAKIEFDHIEGHKIRGQLARPAEGEKFPALFIPQWAGVYPLQRAWVLDRAREGWLVLNIIAHDLPIDEPEQFYADQKAGPLNDYFGIGIEDRERCYFRRMFLGCYRAVDYLSGHENWDGRTLAVMGASQGGYQAFVTAALHRSVTALFVNVPAGCENTGPLFGRAMPFPYWMREREGKDPGDLAATAPYFDVASFAPGVRVPMMICMGLIDTTCPASGVFAALNRMPGRKEINLMPRAAHQSSGGSHDRWYERQKVWLEALVTSGQPPLDGR